MVSPDHVYLNVAIISNDFIYTIEYNILNLSSFVEHISTEYNVCPIVSCNTEYLLQCIHLCPESIVYKLRVWFSIILEDVCVKVCEKYDRSNHWPSPLVL